VTALPRPTAGAPRPYDFPAVHRDVLSNGVRLLVVPMPRLPLVTVLALVDAGAATESAAQAGVAELTARTLMEGTGLLDGAAVIEAFERLGTAVGTWADWDDSGASFTVTRSRLDAALAQFADGLRAPRFPAADVARRRDERLADLQQQLAEPRGLADERFDGFLYAPTSRYARPLGGSATTVSALDDVAVRAFHAARYGPAVTSLLFVGDITPEDARVMAEQRFGSWRTTATTAATPEATVARRERHAILVAKPDAPQSELRVGHLGVPRAHPDYLAIVVMNAVLGGLFSSRINLNLREKHAFTYGASSGFEWRRSAGSFVVRTAVKTEVTARALEEILREIDGMRAAPPTAAEVSLATDYLAGVFPIRFESTSAVAGALANATSFGLPDDWFSTYRDRIRAITPAQVHAAAQAHLHPDRLLVLAVGDAPAIADSVAAQGVGPVMTVTAEHDPSEAR